MLYIYIASPYQHIYIYTVYIQIYLFCCISTCICILMHVYMLLHVIHCHLVIKKNNLNLFFHFITHLVKSFHIWHQIFQSSSMFFILFREDLFDFFKNQNINWSHLAQQLTFRLNSLLLINFQAAAQRHSAHTHLHCCLQHLCLHVLDFFIRSFILLYVLFPYSRQLV